MTIGRLRAIDENGISLDAEFTLDATERTFEITMESRSGRGRGVLPRNPDYEKLMALVFRRAAALDAVLAGAWVTSAKTRGLPEAGRLLAADGFAYPVHLASVADLEAFRTRLSGAQGAIGREPGARGAGNRNKRVTMAFQIPGTISPAAVEAAIVSGDVPGRELLAAHVTGAQPVQLEASYLDLGRVQAVLNRYEYAAPRVRRRVQREIERGQVGELVKALNGYRCQLCAGLDLPAIGFRTRSGHPYVEAHHVDAVAGGARGVLRAANVITVCPSHHRELHYGAGVAVADLGEAFRITVEAGTATVPKVAIAGREA